jgi:hypothetical protein
VDFGGVLSATASAGVVKPVGGVGGQQFRSEVDGL